MAYTGQITGRQRLLAGSAALLAAFAIGAGLVGGLDLHVVRAASEAISAIAIPAPKPPQDVIVPAKTQHEKASGKASAANRFARAAPVAAPEPRLPPPEPPTVSAAPRARPGQRCVGRGSPRPRPGLGLRRARRRDRRRRFGQRHRWRQQGGLAQRHDPRQRLSARSQPRQSGRRGRGSLHHRSDRTGDRMPRQPIERRCVARCDDLSADRRALSFQARDQRRGRSDPQPLWLAADLVARAT